MTSTCEIGLAGPSPIRKKCESSIRGADTKAYTCEANNFTCVQNNGSNPQQNGSSNWSPFPAAIAGFMVSQSLACASNLCTHSQCATRVLMTPKRADFIQV